VYPLQQARSGNHTLSASHITQNHGEGAAAPESRRSTDAQAMMHKQARTCPHHQSTSAVGRSEPSWNPWPSRLARCPNVIRFMAQLPLHNPMRRDIWLSWQACDRFAWAFGRAGCWGCWFRRSKESAFVRSALREPSVGLCWGNCGPTQPHARAPKRRPHKGSLTHCAQPGSLHTQTPKQSYRRFA
jgi:hypothetical protein